jgi:Holliday junction resolvase
MARTPEGRVKDAVVKVLKEFGVYYFMPIGGAFTKVGVPDVIGCYNGNFIAIECKAGKNTPTALQEREIRLIKEAGGIALVVNETNLNDVRITLEELDHVRRLRDS